MSRQVMTSMVMDDSDDDAKHAERDSLADLKHRGKKKAIAPVNRIGAAVKSKHMHPHKLFLSNTELMFLTLPTAFSSSIVGFVKDFYFQCVVFLGTGSSQGLQSQGALASNNAANSRFVVFDENKIPGDEPAQPKVESWMAPPPARAKENEQKPEKWCDVKV